jgi:hypothetical protein
LRRGTGLAALVLLTFLLGVGAASASAAGLAKGHYKHVCGAVVSGHVRCHADIVTDASNNPLATLGPAGYGPSDLRSAYDFAATAASGGTGTTVAIVDAYDDPNAESDMGVYRSQYGLSACTTANGCFRKVNQTGGTAYPIGNASWAEEISLDLDMISATCPNCHIILVEAASTSFSNLDAAENEAASLGANVISNSWGGSESSGETSLESNFNHPGIAVTASTGDSGYGTEYPAASQYVTAVGGTTLSTASNARGWTESAWSGGGSGCSAYIAKPSWQQDSGCSNRTIADVSADADPNTGVAVYDTYGDPGWLIFGGTSESAQIMAGIYALIGEPAATDDSSYPYTHTSQFYDITSGSNGSCGTYLCNAGPGYDGPTGIGTPNGGALFGSVCSANPIVTMNPSDETVTAPSGASFTAAATNPANCGALSVRWQVSSDGGATWSNDTADAGNTIGTLSINPTSTSQSGNEYRAVFSNEHGSTNSDPAPLTVNAPPPTATQPPPTATQPPPTASQPPATASQPPATASQPPPTTSLPPPTATALLPVISNVRMSPYKLSISGRQVNGKCVKPTNKNNSSKHCLREITLKISYMLNGGDTVTFTFKRTAPGRQVNGKCVEPTNKNNLKKKCTRLISVNRKVVQTGKAGANSFSWNGKVGGHKLGPGTYQLTATPAGGKSQIVTFTILA